MRPQSTTFSIALGSTSHIHTSSWLPPFFSGGLATVGEWTLGWYRQAKESVWTTCSEPEELFFLKAQENEHFMRFQAWSTALKRDLREIRSAILSSEINAVELGERLLASQAPEQMAEHILSPVMYSLMLSQLERGLRKQAAIKNNVTDVNSQELILAANVIQKARQQLRSSLSNDPELAGEYLANDLFNAIILYSSDQISKAGLTTILNYYQGLIDHELRKQLTRLVEALTENATDPNYPFDFAKVNRQIKSLLQDVQAVFDDNYEAIPYKNGLVQTERQSSSYAQRFDTFLDMTYKSAKDFTYQCIRFVRTPPQRTVATIASAAALGYLYYTSKRDTSTNIFPYHGLTPQTPWQYSPSSFSSQVIDLLTYSSIVYGVNMLSGSYVFGAPILLVASLFSSFESVFAQATMPSKTVATQTRTIPLLTTAMMSLTDTTVSFTSTVTVTHAPTYTKTIATKSHLATTASITAPIITQEPAAFLKTFGAHSSGSSIYLTNDQGYRTYVLNMVHEH